MWINDTNYMDYVHRMNETIGFGDTCEYTTLENLWLYSDHLHSSTYVQYFISYFW